MKKRIWRVSSISALAFIFVFACGIFVTATAGLTPEQAQELGEIQRAIKAKGATWKAGETSVFKLSREAKKRLCGVLFDEKPGMVSTGGTTEQTFTTDTDSFDWRVQSPNVVTPIKDQGNCGSCWAFAAVGAMESTLMINTNANEEDLSEQLVVSCDRSNFGCNGGYMDRVYDFLSGTGTTDEDCFPYTSGQTGHSPRCSERCQDWGNRVEKITGWQWVNNNPNDIKAAVLNGPVPTTMSVYSDFYAYVDGVYQHSSGGYVGGHAVIIIGWGVDPSAGGYWICKNSWGTDWGEGGFFKIKWSNCGIGGNTAKYSYTPGECVDSDGDGYSAQYCGGKDCDDSDSSVNPGVTEQCGDNIDNNCNGVIDENCSSPSCSQKGEICTDSSDCCSGKCTGKPGAQTCK